MGRSKWDEMGLEQVPDNNRGWYKSKEMSWLSGERVTVTDKATYLEATTKNEGVKGHNSLDRIRKAMNTFRMIVRPGMSEKRIPANMMADVVQTMVTPVMTYTIHLIPLTEWVIKERKELVKAMIIGMWKWFTKLRRKRLRTLLNGQSLQEMIGKQLSNFAKRLRERSALTPGDRKDHWDITQMTVAMSILYSPLTTHHNTHSKLKFGDYG